MFNEIKNMAFKYIMYISGTGGKCNSKFNLLLPFLSGKIKPPIEFVEEVS